jgi:tetratricopeptide (TPR) repeat protein
MFRPFCALYLLASLFAVSAQAQAQTPLAQAQRLRDTGNFAEAAALLRSQLEQNPDNGDVARLLAQTLYWFKDFPGARAAYETAMARHPEDTRLRLDYARMLAETGEGSRARDLLMSLVSIPGFGAEAETLLGTTYYWDGDLTQGRRRFEEALRANPNQEDARRQLQEIRAVTASWIRVSSSVQRDNQPLVRATFGFEAGWFATPLTQLTFRVEPQQYWRSSAADRTVGLAEVALAHYQPRAHLETELAIGAVNRLHGSDPWDWTGRAALGFRLPKQLAVRARLERTPYFAAQASLDTPVMVETAAGLLHWGEIRGWIAEAAYQYHRYPDRNVVQAAYGWILAPLVHHNRVAVQAGYGFATSDANESRFGTTGQYSPYYTPDQVQTHSILAGLRLGAIGRTSLRLDTSYGVRATDNAPFLTVSGGTVVRDTYKREFSPWNVRAGLKIPVGETLTLEPTAEGGRTIFYTWAGAGFQITKRREAR